MLFSVGPLAASVAASEWGLYFGGVFDGCPYEDNIAVNHAGTALYVSVFQNQIFKYFSPGKSNIFQTVK